MKSHTQGRLVHLRCHLHPEREPETAQLATPTTTTAPVKPTPPSQPVVSEPEESSYTFPMQYKIKSGDSFGRIAEKFYKRASLGKWLAAQNEIDPTKMKIGQVWILNIKKSTFL